MSLNGKYFNFSFVSTQIILVLVYIVNVLEEEDMRLQTYVFVYIIC